MGREVKVYIETYGCALSRGESYVMETVLRGRGARIVDSPEEADVVILNTCIVRGETEDRMRRRIKALHEELSHRGKRLVVAGCMAKAMPYTVSRLAPSSSLVAPQCVHRVDEAVFSRGRVLLLGDERGRDGVLPRVFRGVIGIVPIADGCLGDCSFCVVKYARRRLISYAPRAIISTVREMVRMGAREIELTAPDTAVYGLDMCGEQLLPELVLRVAEIPGDFMVRVGMMTPEYALRILDELAEMYRHPKVYKFAHLPVQSGDDKVLKLMNRGYTVDEYIALVDELRRRVPGISIATDIIVGHPGEDEEAFQNTLRLVEKLRFERVHFAQYSPRPHTRSASMKQVPEHVKKERSKRLLEVVERVGLEVHRAYVGGIYDALVTEEGHSNTMVARLSNYMPVIVPAGVTLGSRIKVRVLDASYYDLRGEPVGQGTGKKC